MGMINNKPVQLLLLLITVLSTAQKPSIAEARPLSLIAHEGYSKIFATLGVVCKCCDGTNGDCRSTWTESCSNLQCSPWKSH